MDPAIKILAEHYQRSYEATYKFWRQRNSGFLILLALIAASALLTASPSGGHPILLSALASRLGVTNPSDVASLQSTFPFQLVDSIVLLGVFYAMVNLYHRACAVLRGYGYLSAMEKEIRPMLGLRSGAISFSREGAFYNSHQPEGLKTVPAAYVGLLGLLLVLFLYERLSYDVRQSMAGPHTVVHVLWAVVFLIFDSLIAAATLYYYGVYTKVSFCGVKSPTSATTWMLRIRDKFCQEQREQPTADCGCPPDLQSSS